MKERLLVGHTEQDNVNFSGEMPPTQRINVYAAQKQLIDLCAFSASRTWRSNVSED